MVAFERTGLAALARHRQPSRSKMRLRSRRHRALVGVRRMLTTPIPCQDRRPVRTVRRRTPSDTARIAAAALNRREPASRRPPSLFLASLELPAGSMTVRASRHGGRE